MMIALAALGVAFGAFCVWLAVRIVNRRERWAKWTLAMTLFAVFVLYPLSVGPACWISSRRGTVAASRTVNRFYKPFIWCVEKTHSDALRNGLQWYSQLLAADRWRWIWTPWMQAGEATWWGGDGSVLFRDLQ